MEPFNHLLLHQSFHPDIVPTTIRPSPPLGPPLTASPTPYPFSFSFSFSTRDLVSGLVLDLLVVLVVVLVIYNIWVHRNPEGSGTESPARSRRGRDRQETTSSLRVDPTTIIQALPVYSYGEYTKYQVTCAICLGEFEEEEAVKVIPFCKHAFHRECIDRWLSSQVTCPVCRCTHLLNQGASELGERSRVRNDETCIEVMVAEPSREEEQINHVRVQQIELRFKRASSF